MRAGKTILGYFLLGVLLFCTFFLWQFPYDRLKNVWIQNLEGSLPFSLSIDRLTPVFPCYLKLERIRVGADSISFRFPDLVLRPHFPGLILGKPGFDLADTGNPSRVGGNFRWEKNRNNLNLRLNQMEVQALFGKEGSFPIRLSGEASLQWEGRDFDRGNGELWALLERGEIRGVTASRIPLPLTLFDTARGEIQFKGGIARVKRLEASGKNTAFRLPQPIQVSLKGGALPPELFLLFQVPQK
jgi:type II secretion system protein N